MKKLLDKYPVLKIALMCIGIWSLTLIVLNIMQNTLHAEGRTVFETYKTFCTRWDSNSFVQIARDGYVLEGDQRYLIAFLPMYPFVMKLLNMITGIEFWLCGSIISAICGILSAYALYKLLRLNLEEKEAIFGTALFLLYPFSFFMFTGMSESMYLLFLFLCVYYLRREKYILCGVFGFLTTFTRLPGLSIGIIMFIEFVNCGIRWIKGKSREDLKKLFKLAAAMALSLLAFGVYMLINYFKFGNPLQFMIFQQENWGQHMTSPLEVLKMVLFTQIGGAERYGMGFVYGVGYTNLFAFVIFTAVLLWCIIRKRYKDAVYQALYSFLCLSPSWLLSGARYTLGAYPMYEMFAETKKGLRYVLLIVFALVYIAMSWLYINNQIY